MKLFLKSPFFGIKIGRLRPKLALGSAFILPWPDPDSIKGGRFTVKRKSIAKRVRRKVKEVSEKLRHVRHQPVPEQGSWLRAVIQGYFNYHAVPGNRKALDAFRTLLARAWYQSLRRRSQKAKSLTWHRMQRLVTKWLPRPRIRHPYPNQRLCVNYPR